jgi:hypothetical protein
MKYILIVSLCLMVCTGCDTAKTLMSSLSDPNGALSTDDIAAGLKQALTVGTQNSASKLSAVDGFFANAALKVLMPPEAQKVENTLRSIGMGSVVDKAVLAMNRAAEDAAKSAAPIFVDAIKQMTISDALSILQGGDFAATNYFKQKTTLALTNAFKPVISTSLDKVNATKYWADVFNLYNKFSSNPVNTDLAAYVTGKAIDGIFYEVSLEEQKIRKDPAARVTDLLKKVFGSSAAATQAK